MKPFIISLLLCSLTVVAAAQSALTIYNDNFAVVRDTVSLELTAGINQLSYSGVTAQLEPESVILRDPSAQVTLSVVEQSYRGDPVDQARLLQLFEGSTIRFLKQVDGSEVIESGTIIRAPAKVLGTSSSGHSQQQMLQPIIEVDGELRTQLPGLPLFPSLGDDSVLQPTLSWALFSDKNASVDAQLSYLTNGMSWKADYNLVLPKQGDTVTLAGWVSIANQTGKTFEDARIKLIAGDVNKVKPAPQGTRERAYTMALNEAAAAPQVEEKKFDDFHMYTLPLATTLRDRETKQVEFVRADTVQTKKLYVYQGLHAKYYGSLNTNQQYGQNSQPEVAIYREFENNDANGLAVPLPAGRMRFYRMDTDGQLEFTGENSIDHTPRNETIRIYLGNAFDLIGERTRTDFFMHKSQDLMRETFAIEIRNRSEEPVTVHVLEPLFRWSNWKIYAHSHVFEQIDAQTIEFPVSVEADSTVTVQYTVEYSW